jgi:hypothetical protein
MTGYDVAEASTGREMGREENNLTLKQVRSGQVRSGQVRSGQVRSGQVRSGQQRSRESRIKVECSASSYPVFLAPSLIDLKLDSFKASL